MDVLKLSPKEAAFLLLLVGDPIMDKLNHQDTADDTNAVTDTLDDMADELGDISDDVHNIKRACGIAE